MPNLKRSFPATGLGSGSFSDLFQLSLPFLNLPASIEGTIIGQDGNPLVGALIVIERKEIKQHLEVKTDKKGQLCSCRFDIPASIVSP